MDVKEGSWGEGRQSFFQLHPAIMKTYIILETLPNMALRLRILWLGI